MVSAGDLATVRAEGKVALAMSSGFSGLGSFPEGFSELKQMTGISDPALAKALRKLLEENVIERTPQGKYRLRPEQRRQLLTALGPFYNEYLLEKAEMVAKELAGFKWVKAAVLFGSVAQGKASHDSDIDILIILKHRDEFLERSISDVISRLSVRLGVPVEPVFTSVAGFRIVAERRLRLLFGLVEGYRCLLDRARVGTILRKKEEEIRKEYSYDEEIGTWIPKK